MTTAEEPGKGSGPPKGERIVIRDNRKVASEGKSAPAAASAEATPEAKDKAEPETKAAAAEAEEQGQPEADGTPNGRHAADQAADNQPAADEATTDQVDTEPVAEEPVTAEGTPEPALGELAAVRTQLDERTRDLQRVTAEYANYRRRMDRDKAVAADEATAGVFRALLPVFDDLDRAREHGELADGVAAVVEQLVTTAGKFGLTPFGEEGDPFDPTRHEAVAHQTSADVTEPTCVNVLRRGYLLGDRLLRAAMVAVAEPGEPESS